jgi:hypothetical protein
MTTYPERAKLEKFMIMNFLEMIDLIGNENERMLSIFRDLRKELDAGRIENNMVAATDDHDTVWIFQIYKQEGEFYYLEYTGTAK